MRSTLIKIWWWQCREPATLASVLKPNFSTFSRFGLAWALLLVTLTACFGSANQVPVVTVLRPAAGAVFAEDATVDITATATDADGEVDRVTFFVNGVGQVDTTVPYQLSLQARDLGVGAHTLKIIAYDDVGASSQANEVYFRVGQVVDRFELSVAVTGSGTVTSSPAGIQCGASCSAQFEQGSSVRLSATPASGASFLGWGGDCSGNTTCTVSSDANVTASFSSGGPDEDFTLVFMPDTQYYVCSLCRDNNPSLNRWHPDTFGAQTRWIADNLNSENIAFVANAGDVVETATELEEWEIADAAYDMLDGVVPYSVIPGDHDYFPEEYRDADTRYYRQFFGAERYNNYSWYGGSSPSGLSHYQRFRGGGQDFIHIGLEFEPPGPISNPNSTLGWAKAILEANPNTPTILSTHAYLMDGVNRRSRESDQEACYRPGSGLGSEPCRDKPGTLDPNASSGEEIFEALVKPYSQVFMVLNGHYYRRGSSDTSRTSDNGEYHQVSTNNAGSDVYEMLANYQTHDNGGDGWLRLIKFIPGGGANGQDRIRVQTYSPTRDDFQPGSASNFSFDLDFSERLGTP